MTEKEIIKISKFLSLILRHSPQTIDLELDQNGWASVVDLQEKSKKRKVFFMTEQLEEVVAMDSKTRYSFNEDKTKIRANQGHSLKNIDLEFTNQEPPEFLYHGTVSKFISSIKATGLQKRSRLYVHLSKDRATAQNVGSRRGKAIILSIRALEMYHDGFEFYLSQNGVWLTDQVPTKYIEFKK